jgi:hypothetical protein
MKSQYSKKMFTGRTKPIWITTVRISGVIQCLQRDKQKAAVCADTETHRKGAMLMNGSAYLLTSR